MKINKIAATLLFTASIVFSAAPKTTAQIDGIKKRKKLTEQIMENLLAANPILKEDPECPNQLLKDVDPALGKQADALLVKILGKKQAQQVKIFASNAPSLKEGNALALPNSTIYLPYSLIKERKWPKYDEAVSDEAILFLVGHEAAHIKYKDLVSGKIHNELSLISNLKDIDFKKIAIKNAKFGREHEKRADLTSAKALGSTLGGIEFMKICDTFRTQEEKEIYEKEYEFIDHPSDAERIAYLEKFQRELDAKEQKKKKFFAWFSRNK